MPVLKTRETIEVKLPKSKGKVEIYKEQTYGDYLKVTEDKEGDISISILLAMVKDWDFVNVKGVKLQINKDNISRLPLEDVNFLMSEIGKQLPKARLSKKKLSI